MTGGNDSVTGELLFSTRMRDERGRDIGFISEDGYVTWIDGEYSPTWKDRNEVV